TETRSPVGTGWLLGFAAAWFGFWLLVMLPGQFMVVKLASVIDPDGKVGLSSALIALMAAVIVVSVPVVGWLCDRSRPRFGRSERKSTRLNSSHVSISYAVFCL